MSVEWSILHLAQGHSGAQPALDALPLRACFVMRTLRASAHASLHQAHAVSGCAEPQVLRDLLRST